VETQPIWRLISDVCTGPIEGVHTGHHFYIGREGEVTLRVGRYQLKVLYIRGGGSQQSNKALKIFRLKRNRKKRKQRRFYFGVFLG
jgi:hypothetical protein